MAYDSKPTLHLVFVSENGTKEVTFNNVKDTPVEADINAAGAVFNEKFNDPTLEYTNAYYTIDSIVASAA